MAARKQYNEIIILSNQFTNALYVVDAAYRRRRRHHHLDYYQ